MKEKTQLVTNAFRLDSAPDAWLDGLAGVVARQRDRGLGSVGLLYRLHGDGWNLLSVGSSHSDPGLAEHFAMAAPMAPPEAPAFLARGPPLKTFRHDVPALNPRYVDFWTEVSDRRCSFSDLDMVCASDGAGHLVLVVSPSRRALPPVEPSAQTAWRRLVPHVAAALRLRRSTPQTKVRAVLTSDGRCVHATGSAVSASARERLERAVRRRDAARRRHPTKTTSPLDGWARLLDGRWSLVEHFDSDGRRFVLALECAGARDPRRLTPREREVVEQVVGGLANDEIAFDLGISSSTVASLLSSSMKKLAVGRREDLQKLYPGPHTRLVEFCCSGLNVKALVGPTPSVDGLGLSSAERAVTALVLDGWSNHAIAKQRNTSPRTVANQLREVFRKLQVRSRAELVHRLG